MTSILSTLSTILAALIVAMALYGIAREMLTRDANQPTKPAVGKEELWKRRNWRWLGLLCAGSLLGRYAPNPIVQCIALGLAVIGACG